MKKLWRKGAKDNTDIYVAFRGTFYATKNEEIILRISGSSWFRVFFNGSYLSEGPFRNDPIHSEYETVPCSAILGKNVIFAIVHSEGIPTRIAKNIQPYFACEAGNMEIQWTCMQLDAYEQSVRRINPELGWIECCHIKKLPKHFGADDVDGIWELPVQIASDPYGPLSPVEERPVKLIDLTVKQIGSGTLQQRFGYENDDIPAGFYLRSLQPAADAPPDGIWLRYDIGKICLFYFDLEISAPEGSVLEIAYAESLTDGRVAPYITLSGGPSCNLDRYLLKEGIQNVANITPRGGRYIELHVIGDLDSISLHACRFQQRTYFSEITGAFSCKDALLDKIWKTGAVTLQSCAEDAIIDTPTRERGEWTGDAVSASLDICAAAFGDFGLIRRALRHSAYCAAEDGCVAGLSPGEGLCVSSYALQWAAACYRYFTNTGDRQFLESMYPYALKNMHYFQRHYQAGAGLDRDIYWLFIDWGYCTNDGGSDMAANLLLLRAVETMCLWSGILSDYKTQDSFARWKEDITSAIQTYLSSTGYDFRKVGLQRTALSYAEGLIPESQKKHAVQFIKNHYERCFPNQKTAPRLSSPSKNCEQLITPYFSHYVFPLLLDCGEGEFVIRQIKNCWGWMLSQEDGTWLEVFDHRWSHCHEWSGCPTWLLSVFVLGLSRRFDIAENCFALHPVHTGIREADGILPAAGGRIQVSLRAGSQITVCPEIDISVLQQDDTLKAIPAGEVFKFNF